MRAVKAAAAMAVQPAMRWSASDVRRQVNESMGISNSCLLCIIYLEVGRMPYALDLKLDNHYLIHWHWQVGFHSVSRSPGAEMSVQAC